MHAHVQYKLGQHLRSTGDSASCARAAAAYERCLELDPGHSLAAFWLAATRRLAASGGGNGAAVPPGEHQAGSLVTLVDVDEGRDTETLCGLVAFHRGTTPLRRFDCFFDPKTVKKAVLFTLLAAGHYFAFSG